MATYQLLDEPKPGPIAHLTVDPMWPLLSFMLGSPFFAWAWFALNSHAIGSPTKIREFVLCGLGAVGFFIWLFLVGIMRTNGVVDDSMMPYMQLALSIFALTVTYILYVLQNRPFDIYSYFDGKVMSGMPGLFLAIFLGDKLQNVIVSTVLGVLAR